MPNKPFSNLFAGIMFCVGNSSTNFLLASANATSYHACSTLATSYHACSTLASSYHGCSTFASSYHGCSYHTPSYNHLASDDDNNSSFSESKSSARPLAMPQKLFCKSSHVNAGLLWYHSNLVKWIFRSSNRLWQNDDFLQFSIAIFHSHGIV
jgi:hypothetical protein